MRMERLLALEGSRWQPVDLDTDRSFLAQQETTPRIDPVTSEMTSTELDFYQGYKLYQVRDPQWERRDLRLFFLSNGREIHRLAGASPPIHTVNAQGAIRLTEDNALQYLGFFCQFVHGKEGPFFVIDTLDNPIIPEVMRSAEQAGAGEHAKRLFQLYRRPALFGLDAKGRFRACAMVYYSNTIFLADFLIDPNGMVEMADDEPLMIELPARCEFAIS